MLLASDPLSWDIDRPDPWNSRWEASFFSQSTKMNFYEEWQMCVSTLRISELRDIFAATSDGLQHLVEKYARQFIYDSLTDALREEPYHSIFITPEYKEYEQALLSDFKFQLQGDAIQLPNHAWVWTHNYRPCELYFLSTDDFLIVSGLRRFGYVFWNGRRLLDCGKIIEVEGFNYSRNMFLSYGNSCLLVSNQA